MRALLSGLRRAPVRILASITAIGLAIAAIGVFAVPAVASDTLRDLAIEDRVAHVAMDTRNISDGAIAEIRELPGVIGVEARPAAVVDTPDHGRLQVVGFDPDSQAINLVAADVGRLPQPGEALVSEGVAEIGSTVTAAGTEFMVVGEGDTAWWSGTDSMFVVTADAATLVGDGERLLLRHQDPGEQNLDATVDSVRAALATHDGQIVSFPEVLPDNRHPIEEDLVQISTMIGLLGVVAAIVALVLLASTTSTLIVERTREVATMRAMGARRRPLRRRLRRLAVGVSAAGLIVGIPLGVLVANLVARMVLERFVGVTPDIGFSPTVMAASAAFALGGAWLVSWRAARKVTKLPLAEALRDKQGDAWGRRWTDRLISRLRMGGLLSRLAFRNTARRRARAIATGTQVAGGVAAVIVVASLAASVNDFNAAETEPWQWDSRSIAATPGTGFGIDDFGDEGIESAITTLGEVGEWEVEIVGLEPETTMVDTSVEGGRWLDSSRGVVVSKGFAEHQGLAVGETVDVALASGSESYPVVGLHRSRSREIYVPIDVLATDMGDPTSANTLYATGVDLPDPGVAMDTTTVQDMSAEDAAARDAIVAIFGVIGLIVAGVAALGVMSLMAVSLHERRHEVAAMAAIGARRSDVRRVLLFELVPLALVGAAVGVAGGWFGAQAIISAFEASSAVEIGTTFASVAVLPAVVGAVAIVSLVAVFAARRATTRPPAAMLRAAA
ncbi:MAG: ABC transporter permease [Acidimicrobiales bacterium]